MAHFLQGVVASIAHQFPDALFYRETSQRTIALTIDDIPAPNDPDDRSTRLILETIASHRRRHTDHSVHATFFVIGDRLQTQSSILEDILAQGHEIANHGWSDTTAADLSPEEFRRQFLATHQRLAQVTHPRWYRPGRGRYNPAMVQIVRETPGYARSLALASMIPLDTFAGWNRPEFTRWYISQFIFPGAILVLHGGHPQWAENTTIVLTDLLETLYTQGYQVVSLSDLS